MKITFQGIQHYARPAIKTTAALLKNDVSDSFTMYRPVPGQGYSELLTLSGKDLTAFMASQDFCTDDPQDAKDALAELHALDKAEKKTLWRDQFFAYYEAQKAQGTDIEGKPIEEL